MRTVQTDRDMHRMICVQDAALCICAHHAFHLAGKNILKYLSDLEIGSLFFFEDESGTMIYIGTDVT